MRNFTFKKGRVGNSLFARSSFNSFVVMVVMMIMATSSAMAEVIDGLNFKLDSGTLTATLLPKTDKYSGDIVVPEKVKGKDGKVYSVVTFGEACFKDCNDLTTINIPSTVTSLERGSFYGCGSLSSVTIPTSVTSIGGDCFRDCSNLTFVKIPSTVICLGSKCFYGCSSLKSIDIPSSVTLINEYCFGNCSSLISITIPSSVTSLADGCFSGCSSLTSISIPSSVITLGNRCFYMCSSLTSITIPSSVIALEGLCFYGCSSLTSIVIPSSVTSLGNYCFNYCSSLTSITLPFSVTSLAEGCFWGCSSLTSITIPSSVTSLNRYCFRDCGSLTSVTIPSSVESIGDFCFSGCRLDTICFRGKRPAIFLLWDQIPEDCIIKVPAEYLQDYKKAFGDSYYYNISAWNPDESGDGDKPVTPCATPSVSYESGELKFACETAGAKYHYTINDKDMATDALSEDGKVSLSAAYNISVYATADGYSPSEKAEATLYWINANLETANINLAKTRGIVASAHDGIVSISGLDNGEVVKFYAADGKLLGSSSAVGGVASCAVSEKMVIAKIGMDAIKVLIK